MRIKDLTKEDKPREKLIKNGPKNLTNSELLAIILRTGSKKEDVLKLSNNIFKKYDLKSLSRKKTSTLQKELGIGEAKACQIIASFELGRRLSAFKKEDKVKINTAKDIAKIFVPEMGSLKKEHLKGIYLDARRNIIKEETIFVGTLNESLIHPREIFQIALEENSAAIILLHNHPSGNPTPSSFDIEITKEITQVGEIMGIPLLDHIIIGDNKYFSLKEKSLL